MAVIDNDTNQKTIESLRSIQNRLFAIPEDEVNAMSEEDQTKYSDSLHNAGMAVIELETAQLKEINNEFKNKEQELSKAALDLENDLSELTEAVEVINTVSEGFDFVTDILKLLA